MGMARSKNKVSFDPHKEPNFYDLAYVPLSTAVPVPLVTHRMPYTTATVSSTRTTTTAASSELRRIHYKNEEHHEQQVKYVA